MRIDIETRLSKDVLDAVCNRLLCEYKGFDYSIKPNPKGRLLVSVSSKHGFNGCEMTHIENMITGKQSLNKDI